MYTCDITFSIVSHNHGYQVRDIIRDLLNIRTHNYEIILTLNTREDESFLHEFDNEKKIKIIRNLSVKGFGANHNYAFKNCNGRYFVVLNPDVRIIELNLEELFMAMNSNNIGAIGPAVYNAAGKLDDNARKFLTISRLLSRICFGNKLLDYKINNQPIKVDWLAGMFVMFNVEAFKAVGGFDEGYFMYYEDADICRRLSMNGWEIFLIPSAKILHNAQRTSHRSLRYLYWHIQSIARFLVN